MSGLLLTIIVQTIPKIPANEYHKAILIVKSRNAWKKDILKYLLVFITALFSLFIFDKIPIPYIGTAFIFYGFFGFLGGIAGAFRAFYVYKHYFDIYEEDVIKKIE